MSLINQMLRDLDQRQATGATHNAHKNQPSLTIPFIPPRPQAKAPLLKIAFYFITIILLGIASYFSYLSYNYKSTLQQANNNANLMGENNIISNNVAAIKTNTTSLVNKSTKKTSQQEIIQKTSLNTAINTDPVVAANKVAANEATVTKVTNNHEPGLYKATNQPTINNTIKKPVQAVKIVHDHDTNRIQKQSLQLKPEQKSELAYQKGYQFLQQNKIYSAEDKLLLALEYNKKHIKAREVLVSLYLKTGRKIEARETLKQGILYLPRYSNFTKLYARLLIDNKQISKAVRVLLQHKPAITGDLNYYALLAASYQRNNNHAAAAKTYVELLKLKPREGIWWVGMAISLEALGKNKQALDAYEKARQTGTLNTRVSNYSTQRLKQLGIQAEH